MIFTMFFYIYLVTCSRFNDEGTSLQNYCMIKIEFQKHFLTLFVQKCRRWSEKGSQVSDDDISTDKNLSCVFNHLTSFAALFSFTEVGNFMVMWNA